MKTTTSKSSIQNLEEVLKRFLTNKNTFSLCNGEKENLKANLYELLSKLYDNYQLACIDINQIWVYETCYYTFTFESLDEYLSDPENEIDYAPEIFDFLAD